MAGYHAPAVLLAVLAGFFACTVLGKYSHKKQLLMRQNFYAETNICRVTSGLSRPQMGLCLRQPDVVEAALQGLQHAVHECQHQFQEHRWNCSSLSTRTKNPYTSAIFQKGFRETAFAYAISTAGVVLSVARACSQGALINCGCDTHKYKMRRTRDQNIAWKWLGCSHNLHYGMKFSRKFLDAREKGGDIHSEITQHNNHVGRMAVADNMQIKCKCHGMSGGCEIKTCWRAVPDIRIVGRALKEKFRSAVLVDQLNLAKRDLENNRLRKQRKRLKHWTPHKKKHKRLRNDLLFYEKSPNFCEADPHLDTFGTSARSCNLSHAGEGSCAALCCGRGYNIIKQRRTQKCRCKFRWCCSVECDECPVEEWISTCK